MIRYFVVILLFLAAIAIVFVRFAPFDANRFHKPAFPAAPGDYETNNGFTAVREITASPEDVIKALDSIIMNTPRTQRMAGLPGMVLITYETRSGFFGFPDFTNVSVIPPGAVGNAGSLIAIRGRARFGVMDMNVNRKRIEDWLVTLGPLTVTP